VSRSCHCRKVIIVFNRCHSHAVFTYDVEMSDDGHIIGKQHRKHSKPLLRRRHGTGKDVAAAYHNYPPGVKPDNLESYKVDHCE